MHSTNPCTAFSGSQRLATGSLAEVALAVRAAARADTDPILIFDDVSGEVLNLDTRGTDVELMQRLAAMPPPPIETHQSEAEPPAAPVRRGKGRPRLGVVAREVTLLPRHWEWLSSQPGGASVSLRKLVEEARRIQAALENTRLARDAAYHFMTTMARGQPNFEDAVRALYAGDRPRLEGLMAAWPADVRKHAVRLGFGPQAGE